MSGRRREGLAPNLFPFLAVLVCTLGTLILLLAMVAQNAGEAIASTTETEPPSADEGMLDAAELAEAAAQIDRQLREARWHREQTVKMREEQTADLEERRDRLAHLEDHIRRLREELESLSTEIDRTLDPDASTDSGLAQQTLDRVLLEIEQEKEALANLREEVQSQTPRIVIVPHKGPNGTDRRPIYIECRRDGVYLQPGDLRIPKDHLDTLPGLPNPLDAALRTIRHHSLNQYRDAIAPYPLLIVRPDGIPTYVAARSAMQGWDDQFGYELLPGEVDLAFPPGDPALDAKVATTIRQVIDRRVALLAGVGGGAGGGGRGGGSGNGLAGVPYGSATSGPLAGVAQAGAGSANSPGSGSGASGDGLANAIGPGFQNSDGSTPGSRGGYGEDASLGTLEPGQGSPAGMASGAFDGQAVGPGAADLAGTQPGSQGLGGTDAITGAQQQGATNGIGGESGGDSTGGPGGSMNESANATGQGSPPAGWALADNATGSAAGTGAGSSQAASGSATAGGPGGSQGSGSAMPETDDPQSMAGSSSVGLQHAAPPPVTRVGKDWALPPQTNSGPRTEVLRMIRVECHPDRFVLLPEGGRGEPKSYSFADGNLQRAGIEMATDIRERVRHWGTSLPNSRWQPVLEVAVAEGAELRYAQMQRLFEGSGLWIQTREGR